MLGIVEQVLEERDQIIWIIDLSGKIMQLASKKILEALDKIISNLNHFFPDVLYRYHPILSIDWFLSIPPCSSIQFGTNLLIKLIKLPNRRY